MRVKDILKEKNMSVNELAAKMGVSRVALSRQINGNLMLDTAQRIAAALGCPLWHLFVDPNNVGVSPAIICPHCGKKIIIHVDKDNKDENT